MMGTPPRHALRSGLALSGTFVAAGARSFESGSACQPVCAQHQGAGAQARAALAPPAPLHAAAAAAAAAAAVRELEALAAALQGRLRRLPRMEPGPHEPRGVHAPAAAAGGQQAVPGGSARARVPERDERAAAAAPAAPQPPAPDPAELAVPDSAEPGPRPRARSPGCSDREGLAHAASPPAPSARRAPAPAGGRVRGGAAGGAASPGDPRATVERCARLPGSLTCASGPSLAIDDIDEVFRARGYRCAYPTLYCCLHACFRQSQQCLLLWRGCLRAPCAMYQHQVASPC